MGVQVEGIQLREDVLAKLEEAVEQANEAPSETVRDWLKPQMKGYLLKDAVQSRSNTKKRCEPPHRSRKPSERQISPPQPCRRLTRSRPLTRRDRLRGLRQLPNVLREREGVGLPPKGRLVPRRLQGRDDEAARARREAGVPAARQARAGDHGGLARGAQGVEQGGAAGAQVHADALRGPRAARAAGRGQAAATDRLDDCRIGADALEAARGAAARGADAQRPRRRQGGRLQARGQRAGGGAEAEGAEAAECAALFGECSIPPRLAGCLAVLCR